MAIAGPIYVIGDGDYMGLLGVGNGDYIGVYRRM